MKQKLSLIAWLTAIALLCLSGGCSKEESAITNQPGCESCTETTTSTTNGTITTTVSKFTACGDYLIQVDGATSNTQIGGYSIQYGNQPVTYIKKITVCQ